MHKACIGHDQARINVSKHNGANGLTLTPPFIVSLCRVDLQFQGKRSETLAAMKQGWEALMNETFMSQRYLPVVFFGTFTAYAGFAPSPRLRSPCKTPPPQDRNYRQYSRCFQAWNGGGVGWGGPLLCPPGRLVAASPDLRILQTTVSCEVLQHPCSKFLYGHLHGTHRQP